MVDVSSPQLTVIDARQLGAAYKSAEVVHPPKTESHGFVAAEARLAAVAAQAGLPVASGNPVAAIMQSIATTGAHLPQDIALLGRFSNAVKDRSSGVPPREL